jgi:Putative metal-binding motif
VRDDSVTRAAAGGALVVMKLASSRSLPFVFAALTATACVADSLPVGMLDGSSGPDTASSGSGSTTRGSTETGQETQASASGGLDGTSMSASETAGVDSTTGTGCDAQTEVCNGVDDDCDDAIDEDFDLGARCEGGVGTCLAVGVIVCDDRGGAACDATPGRPTPESCNGTDDDCDGVVDNLGETPCMAGVGACEASGSETCVDGQAVCDASPGVPSAELCNGVDDDCNGMIDDAGMLETCNGIDDDCDGGIDEQLNFEPCENGGGICTCFESDAAGNPQGSGPFDAYRTCAPGGGYFYWLCDPALGCSDYPAGCVFGGFHP